MLEAMRDHQSLGRRNFASHIKAEFSISLQFLPNSAGRRVVTLFSIRHRLSFTATSLAWSLTEMSQI